MLDVLAISMPFFALVFLGTAARATKFCTQNDAKTIGRFAFFIALPAFMFKNIASNDPTAFFNWQFLWRYELATILIFAASAFFARLAFGLKKAESGIFGLNNAYPNYGYIGVPLTILAFGEAAALPMGLMLFADTIVLLGMTALYVAEERTSLLSSLGQIALTMVKNPLLQSVVAGLAFAASGLEMPFVLARTISLLADAAAPAALFALGATFYGQPIRRAFAEVASITLIKLIIHPVLVASLFLLLPGIDASLDVLWVKVAIVSACLPVAANVFMLSQFYACYSGRTASAILVSTLMASVTTPVVLYFIFEWL